MTRYSHLRWLAPLGGLVAAGLIALSAAPVSATIVCPTGIKPPSPYCTNVLPTATTGSATNVGAKKATLNGVAGPNVSGGDITQYFFKYGQDDQLRLADADGHDRLLPGRDLAAEPVLQRSKDTERVGQHLRSGAVHELSLPALRQQLRRIGARVET